MKRWGLVVVFCFVGSMASARSFTCEHVFSARMDEVVQFDSGVPLLQKTVHFFKEDGSLDVSESKVFVSSTHACGAEVDFMKDCQALSEESDDGYRFSFACEMTGSAGRLFIYPNGYGVFSCNGGVGTQFFDCE